MDGASLLCYVRGRTESGDIDRNRRAQETILAMKEQWLDELTLEDIIALLPFALERVKVDLPLEDIIGMIEIAKASILGDVNVRKVVFEYGQEVAPHITEGGAWVFQPLVDFRGWTACLLGGHNSESCARLHSLEEK
jgi:anionic cell wall polymer biosynthesis LytR-Cps2A-Psr (LCP) family protein